MRGCLPGVASRKGRGERPQLPPSACLAALALTRPEERIRLDEIESAVWALASRGLSSIAVCRVGKRGIALRCYRALRRSEGISMADMADLVKAICAGIRAGGVPVPIT